MTQTKRQTKAFDRASDVSLSRREAMMEATIHQFPLFARTPRPSPADVDLHAISRPAREFTGDFYFTHRNGRRLWVAIGDVAGKGLEAAVIMAMIQEELEHQIVSCASTNCDPAVVMTRLDLLLRSILPPNRFATALIAHLDDDGSILVANGGHCPLLIARRDGTIEAFGSTGPVVGILPSPHWRSTQAPFERGDTLLAYTDGVIESRSDDDDEFGADRLQRVFSEVASASSARSIAERIKNSVDSHSASRRDDDLTIIVARR